MNPEHSEKVLLNLEEVKVSRWGKKYVHFFLCFLVKDRLDGVNYLNLVQPTNISVGVNLKMAKLSAYRFVPVSAQNDECAWTNV